MKYVGMSRLLKSPERVGDHVPVFASSAARDTYYASSGGPVGGQMCVEEDSGGYRNFQVSRYDPTISGWVRFAPAVGQAYRHPASKGSLAANRVTEYPMASTAWHDSVAVDSASQIALRRSGFWYISLYFDLTYAPTATQRAYAEIRITESGAIRYIRSSVLPGEAKTTVSAVTRVSQGNSPTVRFYAYQNTGATRTTAMGFYLCWLGDVP